MFAFVPFNTVPFSGSPLAPPISGVRRGIAQEQMPRIGASRIIATVKHPTAFRNGTIGNFVRDSMKLHGLVSVFDIAISVVVACYAVVPTSIRVIGSDNRSIKAGLQCASSRLISAATATESAFCSRSGEDKANPAPFADQRHAPLATFVRAKLSLTELRGLDVERRSTGDADNVWGKIRWHLLTSYIGRWVSCPGLYQQRQGFCVPNYIRFAP